MTSIVDRLVFDRARGEVRDQNRRYLLMRPDVLMGMLLRLSDPVRTEALTALAESTAINGKRSIVAYMESIAQGDALALLSTVRQTSPDLGWGCWDFVQEERQLTLTVLNSPFAAGYGNAAFPVCAPITGMFKTIAEIVLGGQVHVVETVCSAMTGNSSCTFVANRAGLSSTNEGVSV
ncbi:V4R domain-containing protein [Paraburkholderia xenovorans]|jgi:predicted hydrocarbon binding protein